MSAVLAVSQLQPKPERRDEFIAFITELAASIHAEPGLLHYSLSTAIDDPDGPLAVVQVYSSIEAFREHSAWIRPNLPTFAGFLATPPQPPTLFQQLTLSGDPKESFGS